MCILCVVECSSGEEPINHSSGVRMIWNIGGSTPSVEDQQCQGDFATQVEGSSQAKSRGSRWRGLVIVIQSQLQQTKEGVFICLSQLVIVIFDMMLLISSFLWASLQELEVLAKNSRYSFVAIGVYSEDMSSLNIYCEDIMSLLQATVVFTIY